MAPRWTQRTIVLALAAAASLLGGCIAEVDEPEVVDEEVVEVGHELEADGLLGFDTEGLDGEGFDAEAPVDDSQGAPPSPGSDVSDPEPTPWEPLLDDPEPTPWGDPNRPIEALAGSNTTS